VGNNCRGTGQRPTERRGPNLYWRGGSTRQHTDRVETRTPVFILGIYISRSLPLSFVYVHLCPSVTSSSLSSLSSLSAQRGMQPPSEQDLLLLLRGGPAAGGGRSEQPKRPAPAEVVDLSSSPAVPATAAEQPDPKRPKPAPSAVRNSPPLSSCMILTPLVAR